MSASLYALTASEEEERNLSKNEREARAKAKEARLKDRADLQKWTPVIFVLPFFWSVKCLITIFVGSLITNLETKWQCTQNFRSFITGQIVFSYWFMLIFTWLYIGPYPAKRLKPVFIAYGLYAFAQFCYAIYGTVIFNIGFSSCRENAFAMWAHTRFEIGTFWLSFSCLCAYLLRYYYEKYEAKKLARERTSLKSKPDNDDEPDRSDDGVGEENTKKKAKDSDEDSEADSEES